MGTFKLISTFSMQRLKKAGKLDLLNRFMAFLPAPKEATDPDDGGSPGTVSLRSIEEEGVPALNISADQVKRMKELIALATELTDQTPAAEETPEMQDVEKRRGSTGNFILNMILNPDVLPDSYRDAARAMEPFFRSYKGFADLPHTEETQKVNGMLQDLAKPQFAEHVTTLGLTVPIADLKRLNDRYAELTHLRDVEWAKRTGEANSTAIFTEAQDLLDDMIALANASSLLQPSEEATNFVRDITYLFDKIRANYKQRESLRKSSDDDEEEENPDTEKPADEEQPGTEQPGTETPDTEQPGTETPGEGTDEEETPNPDGQQPTEPQPGVDTDGDGSPEVV